MACALCANDRSDVARHCAFPTGAEFTRQNAACLTMHQLGVLARAHGAALLGRNGAGSAAILPLSEADDIGGYIVLTWAAADLGIGNALVVQTDEDPQTLTLRVAEEIIATLAA